MLKNSKMEYERKFHGRTRTKEYNSWASAKNRCSNKNVGSYYRYGGRGIKMCNRWKYSFINFLEDMGESPSPMHTLDRINNDGDYKPSNCRWATRKEQNMNRSVSRVYVVDGIKLNPTEMAIKYGKKIRTVYKWIDMHGIKITIEKLKQKG